MTAPFAKAQPTPAPLTCVQQCTAFCNAWATFNTSAKASMSFLAQEFGQNEDLMTAFVRMPDFPNYFCGNSPSPTNNNCSQVCPTSTPKAAQRISKGAPSKSK